MNTVRFVNPRLLTEFREMINSQIGGRTVCQKMALKVKMTILRVMVSLDPIVKKRVKKIIEINYPTIKLSSRNSKFSDSQFFLQL